MTKPEDIPQDVWEEALKLWRDDEMDPGEVIIARSILAERLRSKDEVQRLQTALVRIAVRDRHGRIIKPMENGGYRGVGGMIATFALTGTNGSFVSDETILQQYPDLASAIRNRKEG